ncbi:MAG TPA: DUF4915 domain-containing protein, partial [Candidatus Acidoferrales bacterium]|nr:DUF4915 domain-containing protein [Candidatus Acidoferrales bacterium]
MKSRNYQKNTDDSKSTKLLISFCNVFPKDLALGLFDFENYNFQYVDLHDVKNLGGITGLIPHNGKFWFLTQESGISGFYCLNENFKIISPFHLNETKDAHSLTPFQDGFLITDTSRNRINKITISDDERRIQENEFWKYNSDMYDTVHINSIVCVGDKIFVSLFGQKPEQGWLNAKAGKIYEITENKEICNNLHHPHSLVTIDDYLYFLESGSGSIHRLSRKGDDEVVLKLKGYLRGITSDENYLYVGASARRRKSRSQGTPNVQESSDSDYTHSWIYRINKKTLKFEKKDLTPFGAEIFDLRIVSSEYVIPETKNPLVERIWKYEDEFSSLESKFQNNPLGVLLSIYNSRLDLQQSFPEVQTGNYHNLFSWAVGTPINDLGNKLETELISKNHQFYEQELKKILDVDLIKQKDTLLEEQSSKLKQKDTLLEEQSSKLKQIEEKTGNLVKPLTEMTSELQKTRMELSIIQNSLTWKLLQRFDRSVLKICPPNTRRNKIYHLAIAGLNLVNQKGVVYTAKNTVNLIQSGNLGSISHALNDLQSRPDRNLQYRLWLIQNQNMDSMISTRTQIKSFKHLPKISIIMPVYNTDTKWLKIAIDSVMSQFYENWELCIADDCSTNPEIK